MVPSARVPLEVVVGASIFPSAEVVVVVVGASIPSTGVVASPAGAGGCCKLAGPCERGKGRGPPGTGGRGPFGLVAAGYGTRRGGMALISKVVAADARRVGTDRRQSPWLKGEAKEVA
jgi:hypothetical protein